MLMNGYLPYVSSSASMRQSSSDRSKPSSRSTSSPYPLGLYTRDMLHSPFLLPDFFYPLALPGFYPHLAAALPTPSVKPPERDGAKKPGRQLNFGIDAILKNEQVDEEDNTAGIEKEDSKIDKDDCKDEERNKTEVSKTTLGSETKQTPKTASQKLPTFLHAAGYPPLSLHPAMQQSLASQYNFAPPPHHSYGLFERRSESARGQCNAKRKRSWSRAVFSALQRKGLEKRFEVQKYVTKPDRRQLAAVLGLTDAQVKVWFQNRRMKWRHMEEQRKKREQEEKKQTIYKGRKLNAPADVVEKTRCAEKETAEEEHIHVTDSEMESDVGEL